MADKIKYYRLNKIIAKHAHYNMIFGKRSNGKTYAVLDRMLKAYCKEGKEGAYIRRMKEDFTAKNGQSLFEGHIDNGLIEKYSNGVWTHVYYYGRRWYMCRYEKDDKGNKQRITDDKPFCYGFALSSYEHDKSTSYPRIGIICFDEFLTRGYYLPDEFVVFMNCISTIARNKTDVEIFMLGNTVNKYCPYFAEMGLKNIKNMKQGDIDVYKYGDSKLRVAVEYAPDNTGSVGAGNVLFAFNNPKLQMITKGTWEIDIYPHLPYRYKEKDIIYIYFIEFDGEKLQCEIIREGCDIDTGELVKYPITYIHRKTSDWKDIKNDTIYSPDFSPYPNRYTKITKPFNRKMEKILSFYKKDKVFYQDNEVGEVVTNYLKWCNR